MRLRDHILSLLSIGPTCLAVDYDGQTSTCRKCDSSWTHRQSLPVKRCYNCGQTGYLNRICPHPIRCQGDISRNLGIILFLLENRIFGTDILSRSLTSKVRLRDHIPSIICIGPICLAVNYDAQTPTCRKCDSPDHIARVCYIKKCYNCNQSGHLNQMCPHPVHCQGGISQDHCFEIFKIFHKPENKRPLKMHKLQCECSVQRSPNSTSVLKAFRTSHEERLQSDLISQGSFFSFIMDQSPSCLNSV